MASFNKIIIVGYLGRDPEIRYTPQGDAVCNFSVATTEKRNDQEHTTWFRVTVWRRQAEVANQYLSKGRQVYVEGRLAPDKATGGPKVWTKKDGTPSASYDVTASTVRFLDSRNESGPKEQPVAEEEYPF